MLQNTILLDVLNHKPVSRPPIWIMRQAGRILPEYRAIRGSLSGFKELVQTPSLAAEVTVQPVDRLGVDAAIIFSDILVIPECMGLDYNLVEKVGPIFPKTIESEADIDKLGFGESAASSLEYVFDALAHTKKALDNRVPLIGFSGAPWTLMCYMIEGKGSKTFSKAKAMLYKEPQLSHKLLSKLTDTIIAYLKLKVAAGADVLQIFDSWAGVLNKELYNEFCIPYLQRILKELDDIVPTILFSKGAYFALSDLNKCGSTALGVDWTLSMKHVRQAIGDYKILQGNMDPCVLYGSKESIALQVKKVIADVGKNHIFNLGHGVYPDTPLENVMHFVDSVKSNTYE